MKMQIAQVLRPGILLGLFLLAQGHTTAAVVTYRAPAGELLSTEYEVAAEGKKVDVYTARVLDPPFAGKEWDFGGPYAFANFDVDGRVTVKIDRKSTRLNSSHLGISYAVFCL